MKTYFLSFKSFFVGNCRQPRVYKKTPLLLLLSFISILAFGHEQKASARNGLKCRDFKVVLGSCGLSVTTEVSVWCGCIFYGRCGCTVSRTAGENAYAGYIVVDEILNNKVLPLKSLSVTGSDSVFDKETNLTHIIIPGDYPIQRSEDGHKYIIVKVAVQQE